jgi:RNA polymerase sigma-70 factor (ECF subfamily)
MEQLVELAKQGDRKAFDELCSRWYDRVYRFNLKYLSEPNRALDATQNTFLVIYRSINKLRDNAKFKSWLFTIALNSCRDEERREGILEARHLKAAAQAGDQVEPAVHVQYEKFEMGALVRYALRQIPANQREVVMLKEYEGLKFREISEILNESESTVKSRMYYALKNLKKVLAEKQLIHEITG